LIELVFYANDPAVAASALASGVDRIFVDLEILGKAERQRHRDTLINHHQVEDVARIREALPQAALQVRINPVHAGTRAEVEGVIAGGADVIMLPMFTSRAEVDHLLDCARGRVRISLLVETPQAADNLDAILDAGGIQEVYIGINDLHLALGLDFMFQLVADGTVDHLVTIVRDHGLPFGFGGIGRMGADLLPGDRVLAEHLRLGSSFVIMARSFQKGSVDFAGDIAALRAEERSLASLGAAQLHAVHRENITLIRRIADEMRQRRAQGHEASS